jgi:hypothetical protein
MAPVYQRATAKLALNDFTTLKNNGLRQNGAIDRPYRD